MSLARPSATLSAATDQAYARPGQLLLTRPTAMLKAAKDQAYD